jgi:4-hydroxybenzoate polyprenyltransferase
MKRKSGYRNKLTNSDRYLSAALAVVWLVAGLIGLWTFSAESSWLGILISILAIFYGILWVRVTYTGRKLNNLLPGISNKFLNK